MVFYIDNNQIEIEIIIKNNKNLYMRFSNPQTLVVNCNRFITKKQIMEIINKNQKAIQKMYNVIKKEKEQEKYFYYLGKKYIPLYNENNKKIEFNDDQIIAKNKRMLDRFYQNEMMRIGKSEFDRISPYFKALPSIFLKFRKMKTRWGVCNRQNNTITLNSELLKKEIDLIDYVIIHELCHFYEANHSPNFWTHVRQYYPKYKEARKRLRGSYD